MKSLPRFMDWPLRAKMAALLLVASLLPLAIAAIIDIRETRERLVADTGALLSARADHLSDELDAFHRDYQRSVDRLARLPDVVAFFRAEAADRERSGAAARAEFEAWPASDSDIRGVALLDLSGRVTLGTEDRLIGVDLSYRSFVREALRGDRAVTADVYFADHAVDQVPTIAYLTPVRGPDGTKVGLVAIWVHAEALWKVMKASDGLAGPDSFAVLFDHQGIRIAHTFSDDMVFHPGGRLDAATVDALVAERRFGERTRALLEDVREFPLQFDRARAEAPDRGLFRGFAPVNGKWNYGVGRRFSTVPWTVFYMVPEESFNAQIAEVTRQKVLFAAAIILGALVVGALFAALILRPVAALAQATRMIAGGDLAARVKAPHADELGQLGRSFNAMAGQIEHQATALEKGRDELELRVRERTAEVRESEKKYRTLFDTLIEGFCTIEMIFDADGKPVDYRFLEINPAFEKQTGLHNAQGKLMRELAPNHEAHWFEIYGKVALTGEQLHFENEAKALGRHYDVCAYRVGGPESRKVAILFNDITERKAAETKAQAQLARLELLNRITRAIAERQDLQSIFQVVIRSIEESLPVDFSCVCLHDPTASVVTVTSVGIGSAALAMDLAMTENARVAIDENGLSRCVRGHLVYEPDVSEVQFPFPQRLARGGLRALVAAPLLVESKVFGVLIAARRQPQSFSSGECEFLRQVTEHVALASHQAQLHDALQKAYDDLRQTQQAVMQQERLRALGQMASGIAHDINNAISPVGLYTEALLEREPGLSAQGREYLETIRQAIDDVAETVSRMREFYRQREPQLALAAVDLNRVVDQVANLTRARWSDMPQRAGVAIELRRELADGLPAVMAVESEIREALTNLVFNAVDAMPGGGTLTLSTRRIAGGGNGARGQVEVRVADTGTGMSEETRQRCLEPFFTTKGERGTGLGLAMVYGIVQRHGADLDIESAPGRGTAVSLRFALPADPATEPALVTPYEPRMVGRLRLLVVDDDPLLIKSLRDTLEGDGHDVTVATGGQEGIAAFRAALQAGNPFVAVISDLGMPHVDGRQVASAIKAASATTPVILLTGWGQRLVAEGDVPPHVDRVLNKPPKLRELRAALVAVMAAPDVFQSS